MSITVKPYLLKRRKKSNGEIPVYLRITQSGKYSLIAVRDKLGQSISVEARFWDKKKSCIKGSHPSEKALNRAIEKQIEKVRSTVEEAGENVSRKQIVKQVKGNSNEEFFNFAETVYKKLYEEEKFHPYKGMKAAVSNLRKFTGNNLRFNDISPTLLNDFQAWMESDLNNHPNTIVKTIGRIKAIMDDAYRKDLTTNTPFQDPKFQRVKRVESKKKALSTQQIEAIESMDLTYGSKLWHTRNYFMFSFWCFGIRFTDLAFLRWDNVYDGRLIYSMGKNQKEKNIKLLPQALEILNHYRGSNENESIQNENSPGFIFPLLPRKNMTELGYKKKAASKNVIINRNLKEIAKLTDITTNLTFHTSRHSFARWARENKMDMDFIGAALAHSKRATTERYLNSLSEYNLDDEAMVLAKSWNSKK